MLTVTMAQAAVMSTRMTSAEETGSSAGVVREPCVITISLSILFTESRLWPLSHKRRPMITGMGVIGAS